MEIIDFFSVSLKKFISPTITVGVFDGVHIGHQELLLQTKQMAKQSQGDAVVVTFSTHPSEVIGSTSPPFLMPLDKRLQIFKTFKMSACLLIDFSKEIAAITAEDFIEKYLVGMSAIVVGENFNFGKGGKGNPAMLSDFGKKHNFKVKTFCVTDSQIPVSSSFIRKTIQEGKMEQARKMLGRPFSLIGKVVMGKQRGRNLGFPTANLQLQRGVVPKEGVYIGCTQYNSLFYPSLISIGNCPTFEDNHRILVEVYLENFSGNLYGKTIETYCFKKIRDQIKFDDIDALCQQMKQDQCDLLENFSKCLEAYSKSESEYFSVFNSDLIVNEKTGRQ